MAEVRWTVSAAEDLRHIEDWIARDSARHAVEFVDRLVQVAQRLRLHPRAGRVVPEFKRRDLREILHRDYRIVYLLERREVMILRVVHGSQDLRRM